MAVKQLRAIQAKFKGLVETHDFFISTWLALGAIFHLLASAYLPFPAYVSTLVPLAWIAYRWISALMASKTGVFTDVKKGWWTSKFSEKEGDVVCFVLGARLNSPLGKLAPGMEAIGTAFANMWKELDKDPDKFGYLGKTATLVDTSDTKGRTLIWMSYWKNLQGLHAFSASPVHRVGMKGYIDGKYPYAGIMHETYYSSKGNWETIYGNMPPWGLGAAKFVNQTLVPNTKGSTMSSRMTGGGEPGVEKLEEMDSEDRA